VQCTFDRIVDEVVEGRQGVAIRCEARSGGLESAVGGDFEGEVDVGTLGSAEEEDNRAEGIGNR
jgi:hypothetical protein